MQTPTKLRHIAGILGSMVPAPALELTIDGERVLDRPDTFEILKMLGQVETANPPTVPGHYVQTSGMNRRTRRAAAARARKR